MENAKLLFQYNSKISSTVSLNKRKCIIKVNSQKFTGESLLRIVQQINGIIERYGKIKPLIEIQLGMIGMVDKLVYIILEEMCYSLIKDFGINVRLKATVIRNIMSNGFEYSPLCLLSQGKDAEKNCIAYIEQCNKPLDIQKAHYRRIIPRSEPANSDIFCTLMSDVRSFLRLHYGDLKRIEQIAEVVAELCGNAWEHSKSDCLVDLDVANEYEKIGSDAEYGSINLAILNLSENLIGDDLHKKFLEEDPTTLGERYATVSRAHAYHKAFFNHEYTEDTFYGIAAFQDKISGRPGYDATGGTGLPRLIRSIEKGFEGQISYCCSGNSVIFFHSDTLAFNEDGWIGFNLEKDFEHQIPHDKVIGHSLFYLPGTGFNLMFIFKRG